MRILALVAITMASLSCSHSTDVTWPAPQAGLQMFPTAREYDPPGEVIRIDNAGVWHNVLDLSARHDTTRHVEVLMTAHYDGTADFLASFLGGIGASVQHQSNLTADVAVFGAKREFIDDNFISSLHSVLDTLPMVNEGRYFLISETVWADSVALKLTRLGKDSGGISFARLAARGSAWRVDTLTLTMFRALSPPLRVFYIAEELHRAPLTKDVGSHNSLDTIPATVPLATSSDTMP